MSVFREIQPATRIVIEHVVKPWYRLTVTLTARGDTTHLAWLQESESAEVATKMCRLADTATSRTSTGLRRYWRAKASDAYSEEDFDCAGDFGLETEKAQPSASGGA